MSLYTKARKHIDMDRVKELREEKIKRKKIADEIREQIREELRNLNNPEFSNWRCDLDESMTTSGLMSTTLPATGDVDLVNVDVSNADTWFGGSDSGTVSASGLSFDQLPSQGDTFTNWSFVNSTSAFDATQVNNLKVTVTTGTGVDAPKSGNPLKVDWVSSSDFGLLGTFSAGGGTQVFELPKEANVGDLRIFYSVSSDGSNPYSTYTNEYFVGKGIFGGTMGSDQSAIAMSIMRQGQNPSDAIKQQFGLVWWLNNVDHGSPVPAAPPSTGVPGSGFTAQDSIDAYNQLWSSYSSLSTKASDLYTITSTNFQRRTPMNVFVGLDSPEATAFIRTDPSMQGLSSEEKKKKLEDMLDASNEYLLKQLGITGSSAKPSDTTMPVSWEQAQHNPTSADDYTGGDDPFDWADEDNDDLEDDTGFPDLELAGVGPYGPGNPAPTNYGDPNKIQWPRNKYKDKKAPPGPGVRMASYKPKGKVLSEKKRLKSPKDITSKIPGYYDGKPAPLGFPMQEPPKMVNGKHPDLVDGKKIANRFNRLDPQSAKAMPPTGNPYIDKKVRAAAKKPK